MRGRTRNQLSKKGKSLRQQFGPRAAQSFLKPDHGSHQDVDAARFDFLDRADVQFHQFGEAFLSHQLPGPLAADVRAELFQLPLNGQVSWHALLGRESFLTVTAQWGVIRAAAKT
jgi:hypothetical protein